MFVLIPTKTRTRAMGMAAGRSARVAGSQKNHEGELR